MLSHVRSQCDRDRTSSRSDRLRDAIDTDSFPGKLLMPESVALMNAFGDRSGTLPSVSISA